jgi:hypothetical protein
MSFSYLFNVTEHTVIGEFATVLVGDMKDIHEPASIRGDVPLLD